MGGGRGNKKRKLAHVPDVDASHQNPGMGATLAHLQQQEPRSLSMEAQDGRAASDSGEWETVKSKKHKKTNYPTLGYSELHRLQSTVKLGDLQSLVLYCLADGPGPQWVSVRHHNMVNKAVVLFVPGLEMDMFNGNIPMQLADGMGLNDEIASPQNALEANSKPVQSFHVANNAQTNRFSSSKPESPDDYLPLQLSEQIPQPLKPLAEMFSHVWPTRAPGDDRMNKVHSPLQAMLQSPISRSQEQRQADKQIKGPKPAQESKNWENSRTSIVEYLLKSEDLAENDYILHPAWWAAAGLDAETEMHKRIEKDHTADNGWVNTQVNTLEDGVIPGQDIQHGSITGGRKVLAMDCEMCTVQGGGSALTRISLVGWDGETVMDELVKPDLPIIDYLTPYSGITAAMLNEITTRLSDIQARLLKILTPQAIIIGHSLDSDLMALKMTHPFIIDTSILYPHPRGPPMKSSLKWLAQKYLAREIQKGHGATGHDSVEDARACLDLVKLKCERGPKWGTQEATNESIFKRLKRSSTHLKMSLPHGAANGTRPGKTGAIIDHGAPEKNFGQMADHCIGCSTDEEILAGVKRAVQGDDDGVLIPGGGVHFTWARLRELDVVRGWRGDNRHDQSADTEPSAATLGEAVARTTSHIKAIHSCLPPCTLFIVYSGTGDPREMARLQERHRTFKREFQTKKWSEIEDKWTDTQEQQLKEACRRAREGIALLCIT